MMGYFNVKEGDDNTGFTSVMGRQAVGSELGTDYIEWIFVQRTTSLCPKSPSVRGIVASLPDHMLV